MRKIFKHKSGITSYAKTKEELVIISKVEGFTHNDNDWTEVKPDNNSSSTPQE